MFKNYIKTAVRSLLRNRFFSVINISGLAISMSICMAIIMLVADQMTYDRYNKNRSRIYRINTVAIGNDGTERNEAATTTLPLKQELLEGYTGVEKVVRIKRGFANNWIEIDQNVNIPVSGYFADPEIFDVFGYELEYGDPATALVEPYSVVLTRKAAKKLFKKENPLGEMLVISEKQVYKVTGVLKETDHKSHIVVEAFASMATVQAQQAEVKSLKDGDKSLDNWFDYTSGWVYIQLEEGKTIADIQPSLKKIEQKHYAVITNPDTQQRVIYKPQALMDITPGAFINNPIGPFLPWLFIWFFAGISGIVMLTSCFNFTNLSIARSLTRAREIGIRKVTGAQRWQVFLQFISESVVISLIALFFACLLLVVLKPLILQLSFTRILKWDLELNYFVVGVFTVFALLVGFLAGLFPAIVLSGFQPVKVLKNLNNLKLFSRIGLRKALLVAQFTFSLIFIITVIVVFNQLKLFLNADHGFAMDHKIVIQLNTTSAQALKTELLRNSLITSVSAASHVPAAGMTLGTSYKRSLEEKEWTTLYYYTVDEDYVKNMGLTMVAGKFYSPEAGASNKNFIVISEQAVSTFHFNSPAEAVGQELIVQHDSTRRQIIGVVKDYNHQMLMEKMKPLALVYKPEDLALLQVSYKGDFKQAEKTVRASWAKINPVLQADIKDFSEEIHKMYVVLFGDVADILAVVSFLAIFISSMGLLGMATYTTETRRKEISIRKILGVENGELIYLLSRGFIVILAVAILIAAPAAWFLNTLWLELLAYHVTVNATVFLTGIGILLVAGIVTIGSQTWRAAYINPIENLKE